jgi:hypothetical protein
MKLTHFLGFAALVLAVQAEVSWYVGSRNITCKGHDDGHIDCAQGHDGGAPEVSRLPPIPPTHPLKTPHPTPSPSDRTHTNHQPTGPTRPPLPLHHTSRYPRPRRRHRAGPAEARHLQHRRRHEGPGVLHALLRDRVLQLALR